MPVKRAERCLRVTDLLVPLPFVEADDRCIFKILHYLFLVPKGPKQLSELPNQLWTTSPATSPVVHFCYSRVVPIGLAAGHALNRLTQHLNQDLLPKS